VSFEQEQIALSPLIAISTDGTLRWQAPELMSGLSDLTAQTDVYAYAISCIEILKMGHLPWHPMDDDTVRHMVLREDTRPVIPLTRFNTPGLQDLLRVCWHRDPGIRPSFETVVENVKMLRRSFGSMDEVAAVCSPAPLLWEDEWHLSRPSPDMRPVEAFGVCFICALQCHRVDVLFVDADSDALAMKSSESCTMDVSHVSQPEDTVPSSNVQMPQMVFYTSGVGDPVAQVLDTASDTLTAHSLKLESQTLVCTATASCASSIFSPTPRSSKSEENLAGVVDVPGCSSSSRDESIAERKNEWIYSLVGPSVRRLYYYYFPRF
jgi:serine/threonine protein kinase